MSYLIIGLCGLAILVVIGFAALVLGGAADSGATDDGPSNGGES